MPVVLTPREVRALLNELSGTMGLLKFAARYLKQVMFGENSIPKKTDAVETRKTRREEIMAREKEQMRIEREQGYHTPSE